MGQRVFLKSRQPGASFPSLGSPTKHLKSLTPQTVKNPNIPRQGGYIRASGEAWPKL